MSKSFTRGASLPPPVTQSGLSRGMGRPYTLPQNRRSTSSLSLGRYASLFFIIGVDETDNELLGLEQIHHFVEILDRYFGNVTNFLSSPFTHDRIRETRPRARLNLHPHGRMFRHRFVSWTLSSTSIRLETTLHPTHECLDS